MCHEQWALTVIKLLRFLVLILITGSGSDDLSAKRDHDANLLALLERCRQHGVKLNRDKLQMKRQSVVFMGHKLTPNGQRPDKRQVEAIVNMPTPENKAALQRLLGMATFLARYCPNFSEVTSPLRQMLADNSEFRWDVRHTEALDKLKQLLTQAPVLRYFSSSLDTTVQCDASSKCVIAGVLMQQKAVVEFASRALTETEQYYAQVEWYCGGWSRIIPNLSHATSNDRTGPTWHNWARDASAPPAH